MASEGAEFRKERYQSSSAKQQRCEGGIKHDKAQKVGLNRCKSVTSQENLGMEESCKACQKAGLFCSCDPLMKCYLLEQITQGI